MRKRHLPQRNPRSGGCGFLKKWVWFIGCPLQVSAAVSASKKERLVYRKQQQPNSELVRESKVVWEHLRRSKPDPGRALAQDEILAMASGHLKEVRL